MVPVLRLLFLKLTITSTKIRFSQVLLLNGIIYISYTLFHSTILKFIRPSPNSFYGCQNIMGIKLVTRLRLGLSRLRKHKFKRSFQDKLNPLCNWGMDVESSTHFLLQCPSYINERCTLMSNLNKINPQISQILCNFWQIHSFLGIRLIVTKRIHIFLTLLLTTCD